MGSGDSHRGVTGRTLAEGMELGRGQDRGEMAVEIRAMARA